MLGIDTSKTPNSLSMGSSKPGTSASLWWTPSPSVCPPSTHLAAPFLRIFAVKYVPEWFPGAEFQRKAREWREAARVMIEAPYEDAKRKYVCTYPLNPLSNFCSFAFVKDRGQLPNCVTKMLLDSQLQNEGSPQIDAELVQSCAGVVFVGKQQQQLHSSANYMTKDLPCRCC